MISCRGPMAVIAFAFVERREAPAPRVARLPASSRADTLAIIVVAGSGLDHLTTAVVHSEGETPPG